jgi:hypothetical protein
MLSLSDQLSKSLRQVLDLEDELKAAKSEIERLKAQNESYESTRSAKRRTLDTSQAAPDKENSNPVEHETTSSCYSSSNIQFELPSTAQSRYRKTSIANILASQAPKLIAPKPAPAAVAQETPLDALDTEKVARKFMDILQAENLSQRFICDELLDSFTISLATLKRLLSEHKPWPQMNEFQRKVYTKINDWCESPAEIQKLKDLSISSKHFFFFVSRFLKGI